MQSNWHFYGPECRYDHALEYNAATWDWPGSAVSASTNWFWFQYWPPIVEAYISITWWPLSDAHFRFMSFDYVDNKVPVNAVGMAELTESDRPAANPLTSRASVASHMQGLQQAGENKFLGYQLYGHCKVAKICLDVAVSGQTNGLYNVKLVPA